MVDSDDLYGPMEVDDDETLVDRDMVPPGFDNTPGSLGRHPTYRDLRAPEVPEGRAQCRLAL
jgi:hypothetical protein